MVDQKNVLTKCLLLLEKCPWNGTWVKPFHSGNVHRDIYIYIYIYNIGNHIGSQYITIWDMRETVTSPGPDAHELVPPVEPRGWSKTPRPGSTPPRQPHSVYQQLKWKTMENL